MGEAKRRKLALLEFCGTVVHISDIADPVESLRRFLCRLSDERIAHRFFSGADREKALKTYQSTMKREGGGLIVIRDGPEIRAVLDYVLTADHKACEVSLLCERGDYAKSLFKYIRLLFPNVLLVGSALSPLSIPMYRFMMRYLDRILLISGIDFAHELAEKMGKKIGEVVPSFVVPLWERYLRSNDHFSMPILNSMEIKGIPLNGTTLKMARLTGYIAMFRVLGNDEEASLEKAYSTIRREELSSEFFNFYGGSLENALEYAEAELAD